MSSGPGKQDLPAEWVRAFARLGDEPVTKRIQMQRAYDRYFVPCAPRLPSSSCTVNWAFFWRLTCTFKTAGSSPTGS